jgi:hypothetical protein
VNTLRIRGHKSDFQLGGDGARVLPFVFLFSVICVMTAPEVKAQSRSGGIEVEELPPLPLLSPPVRGEASPRAASGSARATPTPRAVGTPIMLVPAQQLSAPLPPPRPFASPQVGGTPVTRASATPSSRGAAVPTAQDSASPTPQSRVSPPAPSAPRATATPPARPRSTPTSEQRTQPQSAGTGVGASGLDLTENQARELYTNIVDLANHAVRDMQPSCMDCGATTADSVFDSRTPCRRAWENFYSKPEIDMRIAFGYLDAFQTTEDRIQAAALIERLTKPCEPGVAACGFSRDPDDMELLTKNVVGPNGRTHRVKLRLSTSSHSNSETRNRRETLDQKIQSLRAEDNFYSGLREADFLLYVGHARQGGGPDFSPSVLNSGRRTDFDYYRRERPGYNRLLTELQAAQLSGRAPKILGMFACDSARFFGDGLRRAAPQTGLMLMGPNAYFESNMAQTFLAIDSTLAMRCEEDFDGALSTFNEYAGRPVSPLRLQNFFRNRSH